MKKTSILIVLCLSVFFIQAQRFFYVESNPITNRIVLQGLASGAQYLANSPLGSDYIVKTGVGIQQETHSLQINITLQDSITLKTIYQANEEYSLGIEDRNSRLYVRMLIRGFFEKNIGKIIVCARDDHEYGRSKYLSPRKDKT
jgi:hypothetical protein